jgi:hypothetical protein
MSPSHTIHCTTPRSEPHGPTTHHPRRSQRRTMVGISHVAEMWRFKQPPPRGVSPDQLSTPTMERSAPGGGRATTESVAAARGASTRPLHIRAWASCAQLRCGGSDGEPLRGYSAGTSLYPNAVNQLSPGSIVANHHLPKLSKSDGWWFGVVLCTPGPSATERKVRDGHAQSSAGPGAERFLRGLVAGDCLCVTALPDLTSCT